MLGRYERRTWEYDPALTAPSRYRRACSYDTFIPVPIEALEVSLSGSVAAIVSDAETAIRALNAAGGLALDPLARLLLRTESIASSKVEGMQVDMRTLARAEVSNDIGQKAAPTALEVLGNIDAMQLAIESATAEASIGVEQIVKIHRVLLERAPNQHIAGHVRIAQNWIGGNDYNPCGADFVPPPPEEVDRLLGDLCRFSSSERLPPLVQAAIAHAQFETIHPFEDGNGRTGRALVQIILRRRRFAPAYVPPISVVLAAARERYISGLTAYREGRVEVWLETFAVAAARAARLAHRYLGEVADLQERWRAMLRASARVRSDAAAWRLIDVLPAQPVVTSATAVARTGRTKPAVNQAIEQLVAANVLLPLSGGKRNRAWEASGLLDLLSGLEAGSVPESETAPEHETATASTLVALTSSYGGPSAGDEPVGSDRGQRTTPLPFSDPVHRLAPRAWLVPPGDEPEITLRLAVAMPNVLPLGGGGSTRLVTQLRGQRREEYLIGLLEASPVTPWLRSLGSTWHWSGDVTWIAVGSGSLEFTELWFSPFGIDDRRSPLMARCAFVTGSGDDGNGNVVPSIEAAVDLMVNVRGLAVDRRPDGARATADASPVPAALSLLEVADYLGRLFDFVAVTASAARDLLPPPRPETARVGVWMSVSGGIADQVIDLRRLRRVPRSTGMSQAVSAFGLPVDGGPDLPDEWVRRYVAGLLYEALERGGYRDLDEMMDELVRPASDAVRRIGPVRARG